MATPSTGVGRGVGGGAPEKYKEEYCEEIIHYFRNYSGFPTLEGFATDVLDVDPDTLLNWREKHPKFFGAVKKAKAIQKNTLIQGGLSGEYQTGFAIFVGKNNCDMKDKVEQEVSGLDAININIVKPRKKRGGEDE